MCPLFLCCSMQFKFCLKTSFQASFRWYSCLRCIVSCAFVYSYNSQMLNVLRIYRAEYLQNHQRSFPCGIRDDVCVFRLGNDVYDWVSRNTEKMSGRNRESKSFLHEISISFNRWFERCTHIHTLIYAAKVVYFKHTDLHFEDGNVLIFVCNSYFIQYYFSSS